MTPNRSEGKHDLESFRGNQNRRSHLLRSALMKAINHSPRLSVVNYTGECTYLDDAGERYDDGSSLRSRAYKDGMFNHFFLFFIFFF